MLPPKVEEKVLQGVKVIQVADCCIDHEHHLRHGNMRRTETDRVQNCARVFNVCVLAAVTVVNAAHLGDMFQKLWAGEAVLRGTTVCTVAKQTEQRRIQLKQSTTDKQQTIL